MKSKNKQSNNILVTGSHGFIGKHLVKALEHGGNKVLFIPHEWLTQNPLKLEQITHDIDYIYHLAAYGNMASQQDINEILNANVLGTWNLLQATKNTPYKAFINVSSSSVLLPHQTIYSATKKSAEALCQAFYCEFGKPIITVRPSTVIGRGEQSEHLIPKLIDSCRNKTQIPFVAEPSHDFIDVRDLVNAMINIASWVDLHAGTEFNISSGKNYTNRQILKIVEKLLKKKANIENVDSMRSYDTRDWIVDNTKLLRSGWRPQYTIEETIQWML